MNSKICIVLKTNNSMKYYKSECIQEIFRYIFLHLLLKMGIPF